MRRSRVAPRLVGATHCSVVEPIDDHHACRLGIALDGLPSMKNRTLLKNYHLPGQLEHSIEPIPREPGPGASVKASFK